MSASTNPLRLLADREHLAAIAAKVIRDNEFDVDDLLDRDHGSKAAKVALERAVRCAPASLGRILCAGARFLLYAEYAVIWPREAAEARRDRDEISELQLKVALVLLFEMGHQLGLADDYGWGEASTFYRPWNRVV